MITSNYWAFSQICFLKKSKTLSWKHIISLHSKTQSGRRKQIHKSMCTWLWTYLWLVRFETNLWHILQNPALVPWPGSCCWIVPGPDTVFCGNAPETGTPIFQNIINMDGNFKNSVLISMFLILVALKKNFVPDTIMFSGSWGIGGNSRVLWSKIFGYKLFGICSFSSNFRNLIASWLGEVNEWTAAAFAAAAWAAAAKSIWRWWFCRPISTMLLRAKEICCVLQVLITQSLKF